MNFRVTTNMMMDSYKYNLMQSTNQLNNASNQVLSGRQFSSYSEDPTSATMAFSLRRSLWRNDNQLTNTMFSQQKIQTAWTAAGTVVDGYGLDARADIINALSDTSGAGRSILGISLQETAKSMVDTMNTKYGDHYCFAGNDGLNAPFSWNESTGNIEFRGVNINASPGTEDHYKLMAMTGENEVNYVDIGLGLQSTDEVDPQIISSTAFNNSISGLDFMGYGTDDDGDPLCLASIVNELGKLFESADSDSGEMSEADYEKATRLATKFEEALARSTENYVVLDTKQNFLNSNEDRLIDTQNNLNEHITSVEDVDAAEAIMNMSYQQYCYTAALQIGTQILNQSLLDYMR